MPKIYTKLCVNVTKCQLTYFNKYDTLIMACYSMPVLLYFKYDSTQPKPPEWANDLMLALFFYYFLEFIYLIKSRQIVSI